MKKRAFTNESDTRNAPGLVRKAVELTKQIQALPTGQDKLNEQLDKLCDRMSDEQLRSYNDWFKWAYTNAV